MKPYDNFNFNESYGKEVQKLHTFFFDLFVLQWKGSVTGECSRTLGSGKQVQDKQKYEKTDFLPADQSLSENSSSSPWEQKKQQQTNTQAITSK